MTPSDRPPTPGSINLKFESIPDLRFPLPVGSRRISSWIENLPAQIMARSEAPSEENILGESAYEFIDTDEESRDENATESVASTDLGRLDDIASLAGTEQSGEDEEEESGDEDAPELSSNHEHAVEHAFNTPTLGQSRTSAVFLEDIDRPLTQSIEFEEPHNLLSAETISVKHTVEDFDEEQTATIAQRMMLPNAPKRIAATIRQTMTKQGLSTKAPFRILYIGNHSARQDIIHKIASSVTASVESGIRGQTTRSSSQLYSVVPVTAFGSERTPEIELMQSSGYQIKVEDCVFAENLKFENDPDKPDIIKLMLEDNYSYHSVPDGDGFIVDPQWELPQVAIIYFSENDDSEARRTIITARKFMNRHAIPSIVISHKQSFDKSACMSLDQHSIHMCLESRDPNGRGSIIHRRLPIDLASFLNIDARQMNRNLAYLSGLHEPLEEITTAPRKTDVSLSNTQDSEEPRRIIDLIPQKRADWTPITSAMARLGKVLLLLAFVSAGLQKFTSYNFPLSPAISVNSKVMSAMPISAIASLTTSSAVKVTPAAFSTATSTKTITVQVTQSPGPNSLAVVPSMELGSLFKSSSTNIVNKTSICTAEILSDREVLIRIPSGTKLSWLTKEAMSVNVTRNNNTVETERVYSSDDGVVLLLAKKQAYGLLNISIITTKKPRVNETFQVDFGTSVYQSWQNLMVKFSALFADKSTLIDHQTYEHMRTAMDKIVEEAKLQSHSGLAQMQEARRVVLDHASTSGSSLAELAKSLSNVAVRRGASLSEKVSIHISGAEAKVAKTLHSLENLRGPLDSGILKAQVRSKLLWLKLQGKKEEYARYEQRAADAFRTKTEKVKRAHESALKESILKERLRAKRAARAVRKAGQKIRP